MDHAGIGGLHHCADAGHQGIRAEYNGDRLQGAVQGPFQGHRAGWAIRFRDGGIDGRPVRLGGGEEHHPVDGFAALSR